MARSKKPKQPKSTAGMRLDKYGNPYYAARNEKGHFVKRDYKGRVYYGQDGKLVKAGIGVARADNKTGRKTQAKGGITVQDTQPPKTITQEEVERLRKERIEIDEEGNIISYYGHNPSDLIDDDFDEPVLHDVFSGGKTETLLYDDTDKGRGLRKGKDYVDGTKERSTDDNFVFNPAAQAKWGYKLKEQEYLYKLFKEANEVVREIRELTDADMHKDIIAAEFSYNLDVKPEYLWKRRDAALEILEKGARQYVIDVAAKYRRDFIDNFSNQFEAEDIAEFMAVLETLNDRQFLSVIKYAEKSNLAYVIQSVIDEFGYEYALGEIEKLTHNFQEYKTNSAYRDDVRWKNWRKKD